MSPVEAFHAALDRSATTADAEVLLPDRIAAACVAVLPFDAAGLSMTLLPDRRLPLGSSDPMAATAERLQFALGGGPCTAAHRAHAPVLAINEDLAAQWPVYATQLTAHTPYRTVLSLPVGDPLSGAVVLDLYRRSAGRPGPAVLAAVADVAQACGATLTTALAADTDLELGLPPTLRSPAIAARQTVWQAIGHTTVELQISSTDALAALRGLAFRHDTDLETIAGRILRGEVDPRSDTTG
ncbi:GAF domain-containing protein [Klenkia sp. PcliD-1-E]|uniref:GAF domain-containing protein n=1 Tax=Klenkia sp. PcliD-1-E TaxID=2954492 RepID=UPI0020973D63|nr:GAF domain-containing protein [Klenkia sp. PcliD-1-E]MCO7220914.1 GAF domain-containing protein [Klenkia sp. PcliD-1-E]